jgi:hypothetical protein
MPNKEELDPYLWHLGNLIILGKRLNTDAANRGFAFKRDFYAKSELKMSQQVAAEYTTWDKTTIERQAKKLAPLVVEVWNFDNPSRI